MFAGKESPRTSENGVGAFSGHFYCCKKYWEAKKKKKNIKVPALVFFFFSRKRPKNLMWDGPVLFDNLHDRDDHITNFELLEFVK